MNITGYRYPGALPFQDNYIDRLLFKGREYENQSLFHLVLSENLIVLFAKSGMGKTSLINAGLLQLLREKDFIPLMSRFNDPEKGLLQLFYEGIKDCADKNNIEINEENVVKNTLWQYFKTVEFWSEDTLLTPILIFDQFEEFFTLHSVEKRQSFITQLSDLLKGRLPKVLRESLKPEEQFLYGDTPLNIKIFISIREDFLGQLEELSREIPEILHNRFRITALSRENAIQAIKEPAQIEDEQISTQRFSYAPDAIEAMLTFLGKQKQSKSEGTAGEIEPSQLQLLCQHIENQIRDKTVEENADIIVTESDLGGETGMQKILENFYDNQIERHDYWNKTRIRKLCEKGLISSNDRRLSLEEEEIYRNYKVPKKLLAELVDNRLLRGEARLGSVYYEVTHDTLIEPIRKSQKKHKAKKRKFIAVMALLVLLSVLFLHAFTDININPYKYYEIKVKSKLFFDEAEIHRKNGKMGDAFNDYHMAIKLNPKYSEAYIQIAKILYNQEKYKDVLEILQKLNQVDPTNTFAYNGIGEILYNLGKYDEATGYFQKAIQLDKEKSNIFYAHNRLGKIYYIKEKYDLAIENYKKAIQIEPENNSINASAHTGLGDVYDELGHLNNDQQKYDEAIESYKNAIKCGCDIAYPYYKIGHILHVHKEKHKEAIEQYNKALQIDHKYVDVYNALGYVFYTLNKHDLAIDNYKKAIQFDPKNADAYNSLGDVFFAQNKYDLAIDNYKKAIQLDSKNVTAYNSLGDVFFAQNKYDEALANYKKAIQIDPKNVNANISLGNAYADQKKYDEALEHLNNALKDIDDPNNASYYYNSIGLILTFQNKYDDAIKNLEEAIQIDPKNTSAHCNIGFALYKKGDYDGAKEKYEKTIQTDPKFLCAYQRLGVMYHEHYYDYKEAYRIYKKAYELSPYDISNISNFSESNLTTGRFDKAFELANETLKNQSISVATKLSMKYIEISSLLLNDDWAKSFAELGEFITYYRAIPKDYERSWQYSGSKNYINNSKLTASEKELILTLIDILESPKEEADEKLNELEASLQDIFIKFFKEKKGM